ncbi:hypothetical protein Ccrd_000774, partial [Cynara cardunculus var. scolymus]
MHTSSEECERVCDGCGSKKFCSLYCFWVDQLFVFVRMSRETSVRELLLWFAVILDLNGNEMP